MLASHDIVAQRDYLPKLNEVPIEVDEDEETVKIVQLVKSQEPLVKQILLIMLHHGMNLSNNWFVNTIGAGGVWCFGKIKVKNMLIEMFWVASISTWRFYCQMNWGRMQTIIELKFKWWKTNNINAKKYILGFVIY